MVRIGIVGAMMFVLVGCNDKPAKPAAEPSAASSATTPAPSAKPSASAAPSADPSAKPSSKSIGTAKMDDDGTLTITLYTTGSIRAQMQKQLKKGDPDYDEYLKHVGGLKPGESKSVPPWPDDIDDAQVEGAVKKHIAKESWAAEAKIEITGTDANGRIAVTVRGGPEGLSLRLDPKTYEVVESTPLNR